VRRILGCFKWGRPLLFGLLFVTLALGVFFGLARDVVDKNTIGFDQTILTSLARAASTGMTRFMLFASASATALFIGPILLLLAVLWWRDYRYDWIALTVSVAGASVINQFVKQIFERSRPTLFPHLQQAAGYSFPSGHSQAALAFYAVLAYLVARRVEPKWRIPVYIVAGLWIIIVGLSRNYLEVHYPSDVLAAFAITLPWALAVIFVHQCYAPRVKGEQKVIEPGPGVPPPPRQPSKAD
jgi:undecaprenyl-diphosphatase